MIIRATLTLFAVLVAGATFAQKKSITWQDYDQWKSVGSATISNNGEWAYYTISPQRGDGTLYLMKTASGDKKSFERGSGAAFFNNDQWMKFTLKVPFNIARNAKIEKLKDNKEPKDTIAILNLSTMNVTTFPKAKSLKTAENGAAIAYTYEVKTPYAGADSAKKKELKFDRLVILDLQKGDSLTVDSVKNFAIAKNAAMVLYSKESDSLKAVYAFLLDSKKGNSHIKLFENKIGLISPNFTISESGDQAAFLTTPDTLKHAIYDLYYFNSKEDKAKIINHLVANMPQGYAVSRHGNLSFNRDGNRLQFSIAPKPKEVPEVAKIPDDEKFALDIWSWHDTILQTQQLADPKRISEVSYTAAFFPKENRALALGDYNMESVRWAENDDAPFALGTDSKPYSFYTDPEIPLFTGSDVYLIELKTGKRTLLKKNNFGGMHLSPTAKYAAYYNPQDSSWYGIDTKTLTHKRLTNSIPHPLWDENDDHPATKYPYGFQGWIRESENFIIADKFDIWMLSPNGKTEPQNLTKIGRENSIRFRVNNLNRVQGINSLDTTEPIILSGFDTQSMEDGYYALDPKGEVTKLIDGPYIYSIDAYARNSNQILLSRGSFREYPDLWITDRSFNSPKKITSANPQQAEYKWGDVKMITWTDFNGNSCKGLLYLPDNYDTTKQYPTIVYFYEKHTEELHSHYSPSPSRSIINPTYCTSNDYVVFMPDIKYVVGYPGKSCYDAVVSGTLALIERGIADPKHIGLQGQSWGGYQTAYLITQTDLYACCAPGAIVSNMTSAYGGIRWGSGNPRTYQYETGQSRIGATLWQRRDLYIDNSPLFFADKVNTPVLMRHDDADDAVPWYQGIEFYLALRRMGKPAWMLNYNNEPHNLKSRAASIDWDIRMYQFLDHYLKDAPAPRWMTEGITVIEKNVDQKYELTE